LDTTVSGTITEPGEQDEYTFTGSPGQRVFFDDLGSLPLRLVSPAGETVFSTTNAGDQGPFTLTEAGTYRLIVDPTGPTLGAHRFPLLDLAAATPVALDTVVDGTLPEFLGARLYQFNGLAGQRLIFDSLLNSSSVAWSLYGPGDSSIGGANGVLDD